MKLEKGPQYHNPDALARLIGDANITDVKIEGVDTKGLVDTGAQISAITQSFAETLKLRVHPLSRLMGPNLKLEIEGSGGCDVPYQGYMEVNLKLPDIQKYNQNVVMLIVNDSQFGTKVPIQLGTNIIDEALRVITDKELEKGEQQWRRAKLSSAISKTAEVKTNEEAVLDLKGVNGDVRTTKKVVIPPLETVQVHGLTKYHCHSKRIHVIADQPQNSFANQLVTTSTYTELKPGSSKVTLCVQNLSAREVVLPAKSVIGTISAANVVPPMLAPLVKESDSAEKKVLKEEERKERIETLLKKVDLSASANWNMEDQEEAKKLIADFDHLFALSDMELGKTSIVKHHIKVTDPVPFKERYRRIPPSQFEEVCKHLKKVDLSATANWNTEDQEEAKKLIADFDHLFALSDMELGKTSIVKHHIKVTDPVPFKERYRRIPPSQFEEVCKHLKEMLEIGAIRKSNSLWASAIVLVRKKDGSLRFCIDLRKLNARTVKDTYSLPRIDESIDCLSGAVIFTALDLKSGYWQVEMDEESKALTAFTVGPLGFYECEQMPFGLTNAPTTFQCLMESCLGEMHLNWCIIYLDDVIIFSKTPKEHLQRLRAVFEKLSEAGLKLKPSKCKFFKESLNYLGYRVSKNGIKTDPKKIEAIVNWPTPRTVTEVRSFLGFTNYYRRFIEKYTQIAHPLNVLISGDNASHKNRTVQWSEEVEAAFKELKDHCTKAPILAYADYLHPFKIHTDASGLGLGAVLYQTQDDGLDRVISYASRTLSKSEQRYPAHKLEFLGLKWAVTERFHEYLYGNTFDVHTDNNLLTYVLTTAKLDATGHRWVANLANYNFRLHYRTGKSNVEADALSRIPWDWVIDEETISSLMANVVSKSGSVVESYLNTKLPVHSMAAKVTVSNITTKQWTDYQKEDSSIGYLIDLYKKKKLGHRKPQAGDTEEFRKFLKHKSSYVLKNDLLYRRVWRTQKDTSSFQFILPKKFREQALKGCHNDVGHMGVEQCVDLLRD